MKQVIQLDKEGYFVGFTIADESPLEPGVYLLPADAIDADAPVVPENTRAKWNGCWTIESTENVQAEQSYQQLRAAEYPPVADYLDGIVKGDQSQIAAYIAACHAVKIKYPKTE